MPDEFVNLTGHLVRIFDGGKAIMTLPSEGLFRIETTELDSDQIALGVDVVPVSIATGLGRQLPPLKGGTWLIVSQVAAMGLALAGVRRPDILYPGPSVSDRGRVVGCRGLRWLVV